MKKKALVFIVSYNAEAFIESVLERIPEPLWTHPEFDLDVLIIDDQSSDETVFRALDFASVRPNLNITVLHNPENQGYGGNQKIGYHYAIKHGYDAVVLLHGDGQYPPEHLEDMILPLIHDEADAVFGSRMVNKGDALKGRKCPSINGLATRY